MGNYGIRDQTRIIKAAGDVELFIPHNSRTHQVVNEPDNSRFKDGYGCRSSAALTGGSFFPPVCERNTSLVYVGFNHTLT